MILFTSLKYAVLLQQIFEITTVMENFRRSLTYCDKKINLFFDTCFSYFCFDWLLILTFGGQRTAGTCPVGMIRQFSLTRTHIRMYAYIFKIYKGYETGNTA